MKVIVLATEITPRSKHSKIRFVTSTPQPKSSAFTKSMPLILYAVEKEQKTLKTDSRAIKQPIAAKIENTQKCHLLSSYPGFKAINARIADWINPPKIIKRISVPLCP